MSGTHWKGMKRPEHSEKMKGENNPSKRLDVRKKISKALKGRIMSEEWKRKNSENRKGKGKGDKNGMRKPEVRLKFSGENSHMKLPKYRKMFREKRLFELQKEGINLQKGKNETQLLNELEKLFNYKIEREFTIVGYKPDGYIPELNLCIEIDEEFHFDDNNNLKEKDILRQQEIENKLNCKFLRIKDLL